MRSRKVTLLIAVMMAMSALLCACGEKVPYPKEAVAQAEKVDLDLTTLSSTMVYSEVANIMTTPEEYVGKTMKIEGDFYNFLSSDGTAQFPACVIADATACCQQGIEFELNDGNYPQEGTNVTVIGTFEPYIDNTDGGTYYHLENAQIVS